MNAPHPLWVRTRTELRGTRRRHPHPCWDHLIVAPLWPRYGVNVGTLLELRPARRRTVVVLGHESDGIPPEATKLLDTAVEIPMLGTGLSLNVAAAGSVVGRPTS